MCVTLGPWERGQPDTNFWLGKLRINDDPATEIEYEYDDDGLPTKIGDLEVYYESATGRLVGAELLQTGDRITRNDFGEVEQYEAGFQELPGSGSPPLVGTRLLDITYQRDRLGRIERKVETSRATLASSPVTHVYEYEYDPERGWLEEVTLDGIPVETYAYDANGNRTSWSTSFGSGTATYDAQDRLLTYGPYTYTYTENGELLTKSNGSATTTYGYDVFGNLRTVTLPDGIEIEYLIDGRNRRIGKKVNGTIAQRFLYLGGLSPIADLDAAGNVTTQYLYGRGGNVPDGFVRGGVTYRILTDHLGSVRYVLDAQTGDVVQRLEYDAYGRVILDTNPGFQLSGYAGGIYDPQTGLIRFGARDYEPEVGRWTAKDPIGFAGGSLGLYIYADNEPTRKRDPLGLVVEVADKDALNMVLAALSPEQRQSVGVKDGVVEVPRVSTEDENFNKLVHLVDSPLRFKVATGTIAPATGEEFYYETHDTVVRQLVAQGVPHEEAENLVPPRYLFMGQTTVAKDEAGPHVSVVISDGRGAAQTAPVAELAASAGHELFGHAWLFNQGLPWEHGDPGVHDYLLNVECKSGGWPCF